MPFEKLMEHVAAIGPGEKDLPLGAFADRWGEPAERIMDAIDAHAGTARRADLYIPHSDRLNLPNPRAELPGAVLSSPGQPGRQSSPRRR